MIHSDEENQRWWHGLSNHDKLYLFSGVIERMTNDFARASMVALRSQWHSGLPLAAHQIAKLRKWERILEER